MEKPMEQANSQTIGDVRSSIRKRISADLQ